LPEQHILLVYWVKIAFCKAQIVNGINQIGFANPVVANEAIELFSERYLPLWMVFEIKK
jgi:hypothetical protein